MNLLGIDTSSDNLSLCIVHKDKLIIDFNRRIKFGASSLMTYIDKYFSKNSLNLSDLDALFIGAGPGSFTGLRISFSIVKALSLAGKVRVILVGSFLACAYPFRKREKKIAVITDARKNLIYTGCFKSNKGVLIRETKDKLFELKDFLSRKKDYFFLSHDANIREKALQLYPKLNFYPKNIYPKASNLLPQVLRKLKRGEFSQIDKLIPLYLHPKTCQVRRP